MVTSHQVTPDFARSVGLPEDRFPQTLEEADMVDDVLAKELDKLSVQEHETILFDIHGITPTVEEDAQQVQVMLQEMKALLETLPGNEAYMETKAIDEAYAAEYRLMYLRGEHYNVQAAAEKLVQRLEAKKDYFGGGSILAREIRWSDLSEVAKKVVESGYLVASTVRDSSGRAVIFSSTQYERNSTVRDMEQAIYYYTSLTLRDEETLKSGLVWVFYNLDSWIVSKEYLAPLYRVQKTVPPRLLALHYIFTDEMLRPFIKGMQLFFAREDRFRIKGHFGSMDEIDFSLQTYGIPTDASPQQKDGSWSLDWLHEWLETQQQKEKHEMAIQLKKAAHEHVSSTESTSSEAPSQVEIEIQTNNVIAIPRRFDVILGKTAQARVHTGNRRAVHLCEMHFPQYEEANKFQKTEVAERIISIIRQSGGRFIKWEPSKGWLEETDEIIARKKIGHFLRYIRSKSRTKDPDSNGKHPSSSASPDEDRPNQTTYGQYRKRDLSFESVAQQVTPPSSPLGSTTSDNETSIIPTKMLRI